MQSKAPARFLQVRQPHENQEASSGFYSILPTACSEWAKKKKISYQPLPSSTFFLDMNAETHKKNLFKINFFLLAPGVREWHPN